NFGADPADRDGAARRRRLVTTLSSDVDRPAATPWIWNPRRRPFVLNPGERQPQGRDIPFPNINQLVRPPAGSEFGTDGRATSPVLGRVDLNRLLPDYPSPDPSSGLIREEDRAAFEVAQNARVHLARDLFDRLRAVTGAADPDRVAVGTSQFDAVRWLAQLAV